MLAAQYEVGPIDEDGDMSDDDIFAVKGGVSAEGANVELRVGNAAPGALARLFPRMAAKRKITTR